MAKKTDEGINSYPDLFDTGLAVEAMLVTMIDAGLFEQLPIVEQDESRLEDELHSAIELGMACDRFACAALPLTYARGIHDRRYIQSRRRYPALS